MKITSLTLTFEKKYSLEDFFGLIFLPNFNIEISPIIKCFRRYRTHIIGIQCLDNNNVRFSFSFPKREFLEKFRNEYTQIIKELSE